MTLGPESWLCPRFSVGRGGTKSCNNRNSLITCYLLYHFALIRLLFQSCRRPDNYTGSYIWMTYSPQRYASAVKIITVQFCHSILYKWQKQAHYRNLLLMLSGESRLFRRDWAHNCHPRNLTTDGHFEPVKYWGV